MAKARPIREAGIEMTQFRLTARGLMTSAANWSRCRSAAPIPPLRTIGRRRSSSRPPTAWLEPTSMISSKLAAWQRRHWAGGHPHADHDDRVAGPQRGTVDGYRNVLIDFVR